MNPLKTLRTLTTIFPERGTVIAVTPDTIQVALASGDIQTLPIQVGIKIGDSVIAHQGNVLRTSSPRGEYEV